MSNTRRLRVRPQLRDWRRLDKGQQVVLVVEHGLVVVPEEERHRWTLVVDEQEPEPDACPSCGRP